MQVGQYPGLVSSFVARKKALAVCTQFLFTCSISLLTKATISNGKYEYDTQSVPFFSEIFKFLLSVILSIFTMVLKAKDTVRDEIVIDARTIFLSAIPSAMYFVSNNLNFAVIRELGASNFQLLNNLKILSTALCHRLVMSVSLTAMQYRMLFLIMLGCMVSQTSQNFESEDDKNLLIYHHKPRINMGYVHMFCIIFLGAFSSVFCEKFLKHDKNDINIQNILLYSWGVIFASISIFYRSTSETYLSDLFHGHSAISFALVCSYAFSGIAVSAVLKLTDSFTKTFVSIGSTFFVTLVSAVCLGESLSLAHIIGCVVVAIALDIYQDYV